VPVGSVVIVGAGHCGASAARALLDQGFRGEISLIGNEIDGSYERPPLSKDALVASEFELSPILRDVSTTRNDVPVDVDRNGIGAVSIDPIQQCVSLADGGTRCYDALLIATGAKARALTVPGGELALVLRSAADARILRAALRPDARVVVIGGGFIGLEVAASARTLGCSVTVLEAAPRLMGRAVPAEVAATIEERHRNEGVDVYCRAEVARIEVARIKGGDCGLRTVVTNSGHRFTADVVIAGVGATPDTELAERAGIVVDNGVVVDDHLRTSTPNVYAAGDCCSFPLALYGGERMRLESWRNAVEQGAAVAANILGANAPFLSVPWFWSDQYDLGLQVAGLPSMSVTDVVRNRSDGASIVFGLDGSGRVVSAAGVATGTKIAKDIRLAEMLIAGRAPMSPSSRS
jgi:3-phenylpropionate/trans-cinnamate dioxygenase ferredoxin reductase component